MCRRHLEQRQYERQQELEAKEKEEEKKDPEPPKEPEVDVKHTPVQPETPPVQLPPSTEEKKRPFVANVADEPEEPKKDDPDPEPVVIHLAKTEKTIEKDIEKGREDRKKNERDAEKEIEKLYRENPRISDVLPHNSRHGIRATEWLARMKNLVQQSAHTALCMRGVTFLAGFAELIGKNKFGLEVDGYSAMISADAEIQNCVEKIAAENLSVFEGVKPWHMLCLLMGGSYISLHQHRKGIKESNKAMEQQPKAPEQPTQQSTPQQQEQKAPPPENVPIPNRPDHRQGEQIASLLAASLNLKSSTRQ